MVKNMKSVAEQLEPVKKALLSVTDNVGLMEANDATKSHIVYMPDSEADSIHADDRKDQQVVQGSIDLYALPGDMKMFDKVQEALDGAGVSFRFSSSQYEDLELNDFIHYEWIFEVS